MEEIKKERVKSNTSAKSKSANSVKQINREKAKVITKDIETEKKHKSVENKDIVKKHKTIKTKIEANENEPIKIQTASIKKVEDIKDAKNVKSKKLDNKKEIENKKGKTKIQKNENNNKPIKDIKANKKARKTELEEELEELEEIEKIEEEIKEIDIEEIQDEIEQHNKISSTENKKIKHKIIPNIAIALILTIFYIFIELGFKNIETINYIVDLKVFSGIFLVIAIYMFEKAYKNENSGNTLYGIEMLILSIFNFSLVYIYYALHTRYETIVFAFAIVVAVYYMVKSIILYIKKKKEYFFEKSDIKEIVSK